MQISASFSACQNYAPRSFGCGQAPQDLRAGLAGMAGGLLAFASMAGRSDRLADQWSSLSQPLRGQEPFLPTTEMSKGQSLQNGRTSVSVDANGTMTASTSPAQPRGGSGRPDTTSFLESFVSGFMNALGMGGGPEGGRDPWGVGGEDCGCKHESSQAQAQGQEGPMGLRVEGGQIVLPNGKKVPFGTRGVIIEMPDGTKVAVGRNGDNDTQNCRWVTAPPGQDIPTDPPGKTNLFSFDGSGNLTQTGVK